MQPYPARIVISALRGSAGKTLVSLGLTAAWREQGHPVVPFKKGPDYIDAAWLSAAAGSECCNLDTFLVNKETIRRWFASRARPGSLAVVEGNRGLFDGVDVEGTHSTAQLAKLLHAPVLLVVDCTKSSRTVAAMVLGCRQLDPEVELAGVVLNRVAQSRHETIVRRSIESICDMPVLGAIPKLHHCRTPERHLGLVPPQEHPSREAVVEEARRVARRYLDLEAIHALACKARPFAVPDWTVPEPERAVPTGLRVGVVRDSVFQFYYPENLAAFEALGAELVVVDSLRDSRLPEIDSLYLGGGFPETQAGKLSENAALRHDLARAIQGGLPVFAECAGLMYLGKELLLAGRTYPLVGALPIRFELSPRPEGHGYTVLRVGDENPYFSLGRRLTGHEFHYSRPHLIDDTDLKFVFDVERGTGFGNNKDGVLYRNVLATYTHFHALGVTDWAAALLRNVKRM